MRRKEEARPNSKTVSSTNQALLSQTKMPLITKSKSAKLSKPEIKSSPTNVQDWSGDDNRYMKSDD